jgi:Zn-dependent protease
MPLLAALIVFELIVMVLSISLHGCAQAWAANRLGDPTARMLGRITLNPVAHFDPFGTALWPLVSILIFHSTLPFGWGRPVPMTYRNFPRRSSRYLQGEILAILAGPAAQMLTACVALLILVIVKHLVPDAQFMFQIASFLSFRVPLDGLASLPSYFPALLLLYMAIVVNLLLCVVNMMPVPFLDGGKVLTYFLPYNAAQAYQRNSTYFMIGFFLLGGVLVNIIFMPLLGVFTGLLKLL